MIDVNVVVVGFWDWEGGYHWDTHKNIDSSETEATDGEELYSAVRLSSLVRCVLL